MEQFLKYFYNIYIDHINKSKTCYYFYKDNTLFWIVKNYRSNKELNDIYKICGEMLNKNVMVSMPIVNNYGSIVSKYEDDDYILLKINCNTSTDLTINDMLNLNKVLSLDLKEQDLYRNNWGSLWESKIDYFEYQIKELGRDKKIVLNSFSYYIGLAENAISIVNVSNLNNNDNINVVLSHKRINYPNMETDYYNPLTFIFDLNVRDISEYLKSMFFYTDRYTTLKELIKYIRKTKLTNYEANMLYARLLYPSYYFDVYESVIENKLDEEELLPIIKRTEEYEMFLKDSYFELAKYYNIEQVKWIINKKEL